jgi:hypothetical protein
MQTADKIQIALLIVQIFVAGVQFVTTLFFIRSVRITQQQEKDAKSQILLAQQQINLMASQYRESLRPLIAVAGQQSNSNFYIIELRNEGLGPALDVTCDDRDVGLEGNVIGSKGTVTAHILKAHPQMRLRTIFSVTYKSVDDQYYATTFYQQANITRVVDYRHLGSSADAGPLADFRSGFMAANSGRTEGN